MLFYSQIVKEAQGLREDADLALDRKCVGGYVQPADGGLAGAWRQESGEHFDGGGFPGAVGAKHGANGPGSDLQREAVDCREGAESAGEVPAGYHANTRSIQLSTIGPAFDG